MKIVVDMNLSTDWVALLRTADVDVLHWSDIGSPDAPDEEILVWSREHNSIVLTRDLDFGAALIVNALPSPSVVQLRLKQIRVERDVVTVRRALALHGRRLGQGAIVTIEPNRIRARVLDPDADL